MSDEETDTENEGFIVHEVNWRSRLVNRLIAKLDDRYNSSRAQTNNNCKPRSARHLGSPSQRPPPKCAPQWAVAESSSTSSSPASSNGQTVVDSPNTPATPLPLSQQLPTNLTTPRCQPRNNSTPSSSSFTSPRVQLQFDDEEVDDLELDEMIMNATRHRI